MESTTGNNTISPTAFEWPDTIRRLHVQALQVVFRVNVRERMPEFPPDRMKVIRGAFNAAMTSVFCENGDLNGRVCDNCNCIYGDLTGGGNGAYAEVERRFASLPSPLIFWSDHSPLDLRPGRELRFNLTIAGKWLEYWPFLIAVFNRMAKYNLGRKPGSYSLDRVIALDHEERPCSVLYEGGRPNPHAILPSISISNFSEPLGGLSELTLRFDTMIILYRNGGPVEQPSFFDLIESLLERMSLLSAAHCGSTYSPQHELAEMLAQGTQMQNQVLLRTLWPKRDSGRSLAVGEPKRHRHLPGLTGSAKLKGETIGQLYPLLRFGQWIHLGKMTTFGLGKFSISSQKNP